MKPNWKLTCSYFRNKLNHSGENSLNSSANTWYNAVPGSARKLFILERGSLVVSDTVGFVRELPHTLVAAFHAKQCKPPCCYAGSPNRNEQIEEVNKVLKETRGNATPQILVLNKIGLFNLSAGAAGYERGECGRMRPVSLSARIGEGLEFIKLALAEAVEQRASQQYRYSYKLET